MYNTCIKKRYPLHQFSLFILTGRRVHSKFSQDFVKNSLARGVLHSSESTKSLAYMSEERFNTVKSHLHPVPRRWQGLDGAQTGARTLWQAAASWPSSAPTGPPLPLPLRCQPAHLLIPVLPFYSIVGSKRERETERKIAGALPGQSKQMLRA